MATYQPNKFTLTQKSLGVSKAIPDDARSWYYDDVNFIMRPYISTAEALAYLNTATYRSGNFPVFINTGGTINSSTGALTGGKTTEYWFRSGTTDADLVQKYQDVTPQDISNWNAIPTLQQVLGANPDSGLSPKVASIFIKGPTVTNMTELDSYATTATRKVMFPDNSGTAVLSINGVLPSNTTGDVALSFYTQSQVYTKSEVDGLVGTGGGGTAGVTTFNSRTGAVVPLAGDYTKTMVGLSQVDNTSDATKNSATATLTNKTLTAPVIATIVNGAATLTLPGTTGTLALSSQITGTNSNTNTGDETTASIKSKLGITTLSGTNTGDQDLTGLVTKVTGKSLILDTEITRLSTVVNQVITQGSNIIITGAGTSASPWIINATGGGGGGTGTIINISAGTTSYNITGGTLIEYIIAKGPTPTNVKVGYSVGAGDLVDGPMSTKQSFSVIEYVDSNLPIYFTMASDTTLTIYTR